MVNSEKQKNKIARDFITYGKLSGLAVEVIAEACDQLVRNETQRSTPNSIKLGQSYVRRAKKHGGILYITSLRALGWSELVAGKYKNALKTYMQARSLLRSDDLARGRIDRVLVDVNMYLGRSSEAQKRAKSAMAIFRRKHADADLAKTKVNYANLLHRQDKHKEARKLYSEAADFFLTEKSKMAVALCWYNLANTEVQLFDFDHAQKLYTDARKIFTKYGQDLYATGCLYGMAWLHMLEGEFHTALQELSLCEEHYVKGKQPRELILCQLDRAEILLGLNLFQDAQQAAKLAAKEAKRLGIGYEKSKADLFHGKALIGLGKYSLAKRYIKSAEAGFKKEKSSGFLAATKLASSFAMKSDLKRFRKIDTIRKQFRNAQLPLWEAICDLQILESYPNETTALKRLSHNKAAKVVPHLISRRHTILGDREASRSHLHSAIKHWTTAADVLDSVRAKLPPVDMRSSFFSQNRDPHKKLIEAEAKRDPLIAAVWSERYKTAGLWSPVDDIFENNPARNRVTESLSELANRVTAVSGMLTGQGGKRNISINFNEKKLKPVVNKLRVDLSSIENKKSNNFESNDALASKIKKCSYKIPIVQFHVGEKDLLAFVHHRGSSKAHRYLDGVQQINNFVARWRFLTECSPSSHRHQRHVDLIDEKKLLQQIGSILLPPLELPSNASNILLIPEGQCSSLPWSAMSCNNQPMIDNFNIMITPSFKHFLRSQKLKDTSEAVKLFVGSTSGLKHLHREIDTVQSAFPHQQTTLYDPCTRNDMLNSGEAGIWHYAGHASLRSDNPFYSSLMLNDGPLFAADFRMKKNIVGLVTLAACRTGQQTSLPGEESSGLVRSLLEMGAKNVVASNWAVSDLSTSLWMDIMYKNYLSGATIGDSLRTAAQNVKEKYPSAFHWASFSLFGAG